MLSQKINYSVSVWTRLKKHKQPKLERKRDKKMNQPFNDQPVETLIDKGLIQEGTVLDLSLKYIGSVL